MHIVLRLCTDDDGVVDFYGDVDKQVELSLEVIDDQAAEAKELAKVGNDWLVYSPLLHKIREGGTFMKLMDLLDERQFLPSEVYIFCQLICKTGAGGEAPLPQQPDAFVKEVERRQALQESYVYNPISKRSDRPFDLRNLHRAMLGRKAGNCAVM